MNKKVLTLVLVVFLAMTCVFAYRGEIKVGLNLGAGLDGWSKSNSGSKNDVGLYAGFYGTGTFQYGLTDSFSIKAEVGVNTFSQIIRNGKATSVSSRTANVLASVAAVYDLPIDRIFAMDVQVGLDSIIGKPAVSSDGSNVALGLGLGTGFIVNCTDEIAVSLRVKLPIYLINTNSAYRETISNGNYTLLGAQCNLGITYSL